MIDSWYTDNLICPVENEPLQAEDGVLVSPGGRRYPVVDGIPVMLVEEAEQTIGVAADSLRFAQKDKSESEDPHSVETLGISAEEKKELRNLIEKGTSEVDPVVSYLIAATNGIAYKSVIGDLTSYPIPNLRLPRVGKASFLDIGCNWGRWSIAAAKKGYRAVGVDPSLGAVKAARRVNEEYGLDNRYVVADARYLPFRSSRFDNVFSYSVLQHFSREDARSSLAEASRVLKDEGESLIQMANAWGLRSLYHQARRGFREGREFEVRYWTVPELKRTFETHIGPSTIEADCFFGLGLQASDTEFMSPLARAATRASERLRSISENLSLLRYVADSVYVRSFSEKQ